MMWFGQTNLNVNRFETGLSASVNRLLVLETNCIRQLERKLAQIILEGFPRRLLCLFLPIMLFPTAPDYI